MDAYSHSSHPDSGDSSPHSAGEAAAADEAHHPAAAAPPEPAPPPRVRLMVSYGGRIQPRPHDNQLSYVNGETKILSLERPLRFADFAARLAALAGGGGDVCVKYQLPGEDLDALVSVTNDEDLDHLVLEFDRLQLVRAPPAGSGGSSRGGAATPRLRVFLFPVHPPPPPPAALLEPKPDRHWFVDALNSVPPPSKKEAVVAAVSPPAAGHSVTLQPPPPPSPDYLFGLDHGFMPPPAVKVKDPAGEPPTARENVPVEIPAKEDRHTNGGGAAGGGEHHAVSPVVSPAELQRQIQELEKLQVTDNNQQPAPAQAPAPPAAAIPRNGSDETLTRAYPPAANTADYYLPKFPEKHSAPPTSSAPPQAFLPVQGSFMQGRYTSVAASGGNDHAQLFFIPATHGYYAAAPGGASYPAVYAVPPPPAPTKVVRQAATDAANAAVRTDNANANANTAAYAPQVAYDSTGRAIYYTSILPPYPAAVPAASAAATLGTEAAKPVKPTVS